MHSNTGRLRLRLRARDLQGKGEEFATRAEAIEQFLMDWFNTQHCSDITPAVVTLADHTAAQGQHNGRSITVPAPPALSLQALELVEAQLHAPPLPRLAHFVRLHEPALWDAFYAADAVHAPTQPAVWVDGGPSPGTAYHTWVRFTQPNGTVGCPAGQLCELD